MNDTTVKIIEDTLLTAATVLAWAEEGGTIGEYDREEISSTIVDIAARTFCVLGLDRDAIGSYIWVPATVEKQFEQAVADRYEGAIA